jgi:hypothetical protein
MKSVNGYTLFIKRKAKEIIIAEGEVFPIISCLFPFACLEVKKNVLVSWTCELLNLLCHYSGSSYQDMAGFVTLFFHKEFYVVQNK